jgi:tryptophanyl-tRNA synthetase
LWYNKKMKYAVETFTGIRPTSELTVANYIGAIKPVLRYEADDPSAGSSVFLAELHATTTHSPRDVLTYSRELGRTLIASGIRGDIYSQRSLQDLVAEAELSIRGLTSVARLLRLPTLKEKVMRTDNTANANVALAMYPMLMAADIILARPHYVPTGKDQKPHLELTNELIRTFNNTHGSDLPEPEMLELQLPNILSLDASERKMSKSYPGGAVFLDSTPEQGAKQIRRAISASEPGPQMDTVVNNLLEIASGVSPLPLPQELYALATAVKGGEKRMGEFKAEVGAIVAGFLKEMKEKRDSVGDVQVVERINEGTEKMRAIGAETIAHMRSAYWGD